MEGTWRNKSVVIDVTAPTMTTVASKTANEPYGTGDVITIDIDFSKAANVTGTPLQALTAGGTASYTSCRRNEHARVDYTVAAGPNNAHLDVASTGALTLNGGPIFDSAMEPHEANLALPAPGDGASAGANTSPITRPYRRALAIFRAAPRRMEPRDSQPIELGRTR